jgi:hypothetical protein
MLGARATSFFSVAQALLPASFYRAAISSELGLRITSHPMNARGQAEACPTETGINGTNTPSSFAGHGMPCPY